MKINLIEFLRISLNWILDIENSMINWINFRPADQFFTNFEQFFHVLMIIFLFFSAVSFENVFLIFWFLLRPCEIINREKIDRKINILNLIWIQNRFLEEKLASLFELKDWVFLISYPFHRNRSKFGWIWRKSDKYRPCVDQLLCV